MFYAPQRSRKKKEYNSSIMLSKKIDIDTLLPSVWGKIKPFLFHPFLCYIRERDEQVSSGLRLKW